MEQSISLLLQIINAFAAVVETPAQPELAFALPESSDFAVNKFADWEDEDEDEDDEDEDEDDDFGWDDEDDDFEDDEDDDY
ncbi:MAG TPA: hypothetical protein VFF04_06835 [Candidatus Babeliales bacterium]|nr:hypothetical protein [Candidatus Babeliales bacterium]